MNMTLENLCNLEKIGQLKSHVTSREEVQRLLDAARRNLSDAGVEVISCGMWKHGESSNEFAISFLVRTSVIVDDRNVVRMTLLPRLSYAA